MLNQGQSTGIHGFAKRDSMQFVGFETGMQQMRHDGYAKTVGNQVFDGG